jgi:hypothetical protein
VTKGGAYYRTEVTKDQEGKDVSRRVMNTVEVRDVTGKVHNVPLSYGLNSTRRNDGNYELTLAARVDEAGVAKSITQIVVSGEEGARYYKTLGARLRQEGVNFVDQNFADGPTPAGGRAIVVPPPRPSALTLCGEVRPRKQGLPWGLKMLQGELAPFLLRDPKGTPRQTIPRCICGIKVSIKTGGFMPPLFSVEL